MRHGPESENDAHSFTTQPGMGTTIVTEYRCFSISIVDISYDIS